MNKESNQSKVEIMAKTNSCFEECSIICEVNVYAERTSSCTASKQINEEQSVTYHVRPSRMDRYYGYGSAAVYSCKNGYYLEGNPVRYCGEKGQWTGQAPHCKEIVCESKPNISGYITWPKWKERQYKYGAVLEGSCITGYKPTLGTRINSTCNDKGSWTIAPSDAQCDEIVCESKPNISAYITWPKWKERQYKFGAVLEGSCVPGYKPTLGTRINSTCNDKGSWTISPPDAQCVEEPKRVPMIFVILSIGAIFLLITLAILAVIFCRRPQMRSKGSPTEENHVYDPVYYSEPSENVRYETLPCTQQMKCEEERRHSTHFYEEIDGSEMLDSGIYSSVIYAEINANGKREEKELTQSCAAVQTSEVVAEPVFSSSLYEDAYASPALTERQGCSLKSAKKPRHLHEEEEGGERVKDFAAFYAKIDIKQKLKQRREKAKLLTNDSNSFPLLEKGAAASQSCTEQQGNSLKPAEKPTNHHEGKHEGEDVEEPFYFVLDYGYIRQHEGHIPQGRGENGIR